MKAEQVKKLMDDVIDQENRDYQFLGIKESPRKTIYEFIIVKWKPSNKPPYYKFYKETNYAGNRT